MPLWSDFTSAISTLGTVGKRLTGGGSYLSAEEQVKEQAFHETVKSALSKVDEEISAVPGINAAKKLAPKVGDLLLRGAIQLNTKVISPYITRPLSTVGLLTDTNSPLYKKGEYEEGFQFSDIKSAYARSAKVSTFQALTKSNLIPLVKPLSAAVLSTGKINLDDVDLWDDKSIEKNYVDNAVGRWFTGIGDFVVGNAALGAVGKVAGIAAKAGGTKAGLYTANKTVADLAADMETGILHASTLGKQGSQTVSGSHVLLLAESKDYGVISDLVGKYSTNGKLVNLIHDASTPEAVKDLLLADKGDIGALSRLSVTAPDELFELSDTASQLQAKFLSTGKSYVPQGPAVERLKSAYDAAIKKNPQYVKLRDAFFDPQGGLTPGGKAFMPIEPAFGASALIKGQQVVRDIKGAARFREYDKLNELRELKLPGRVGGAAVSLVRSVGRGTESLPTGFVTFSGMRPLDGRIELNSFLNNIRLFDDGAKEVWVSPTTKMKAGDVRREFEEQYMMSAGKNEVQALDAIDEKIGKMIAYNNGVFDDVEIASHIREYRGNVNRGLDSMKANGYAIGHDGRAIMADAQTIRQFTESYRFTPWDSIERKMGLDYTESAMKRGAGKSKDVVVNGFRDLNRLWTFDVLVRPMYIPKQSIFEPIVSATISQGMDFIWKDVLNNPLSTNGMVGRAARNFKNWSFQGGTKVLTKGQRKKIDSVIADKYAEYNQALAIKSTLQVEVEDLLKGGASPAVKASAIAPARKELQAAEALLDRVELELRAAAVPIGKKEAIPSLATLERRVGFLTSRTTNAATKAEVAKAQQAIDNYKDIISKMATNKKVIQDADVALSNAYGNIDRILGELKPALKAKADVWGKNEAFKKRYYAKENQNVLLENGEYVNIDSFVTGDNNFSAAVRAEVSNARTTDLNVMGQLSVGTRQGVLSRKIPRSTIKVSDTGYFAELQHIANRQFRGDPLIDLILKDTPMTELIKWGKSSSGRNHLAAFDIYEVKQIEPFLADKVALVNRTIPSGEARLLLAQRELTEAELVSYLAPYADELYDIVPTNFSYGVADAPLGTGKYAAISDLANNTAAAIFRKMASAENPIRNAYFDNAALDAMARKISYLQSQGVDMSVSNWNSLRQSAGREAIQELEKTVYTVRRQNRLMHSARAVVAFPTATVNAFYRYGRLAAKNPVRSTGFAYNYGRTFQNFGVDENGNPTEDINAITHIIVPGTKELGLGFMDEGLALNSKSLGFLLNQPSPSFISALSVGSVMRKFPGTEEGIRGILNAGGANLFDTWFPYGPPTSLTKTFTPPYLNSLYNAATGNQGKSDYLSSWTSVYNYHKMMVEMGIEDEFPTDAKIEEEVRSLWAEKFLSGFISVAGVPYKVETSPMRMTTNLYYKLVEKYNKMGYSTQQARDAAGTELLNTVGTQFMLDRVTTSNTGKNISIPATYEAYKTVFDDNDELVGALAGIDSGDVGLISLLTADMSRDPSEQSSNILGILSNPNLKLPGTSKRINDFKLTPQEAEAERLKNRTWRQYSLVRDALEARITDGKTLRSHPELKVVLDQLVATTFKDQSQAWFDEYQLSASGDTSYKYARAFSTIVANEKFMGKNGKSQYWQDVKEFMRARSMFATAYQSLPDYDPRKALLKDGYNNWVDANAKQWDPNLETAIKFYFTNDSLKAVG